MSTTAAPQRVKLTGFCHVRAVTSVCLASGCNLNDTSMETAGVRMLRIAAAGVQLRLDVVHAWLTKLVVGF